MKSYKRVLDNSDIEYRNSKDEFHNENGPAIIYADGKTNWFLNDSQHPYKYILQICY